MNIIQCLLGELLQQCLSEVQHSPKATQITVLMQVRTKYSCSNCNMVVRRLSECQFPLR